MNAEELKVIKDIAYELHRIRTELAFELKKIREALELMNEKRE